MLGTVGKINNRVGAFSIVDLEVSPVWTFGDLVPFYFLNGGAVVYNNEIHLLGGDDINNNLVGSTQHYKFDGTTWTSVSTLPYAMDGGSAIVWNNEIHIFGDRTDQTFHYKWDGTSWTRASTSSNLSGCAAVVWNNEIHVMGGINTRKLHQKWDGTKWSTVSTIPFEFYYGCAVVYNNEIHILGGGGTAGTYHYKWNGTSWVSVSTLPNSQVQFTAEVYDNKIYIVMHNYTYAWDGNSWETIDSSTRGGFDKMLVVWNNTLHLFGGAYGNDFFTSMHYTYTPNSRVETMDITIPSNSKILCSNLQLENKDALISNGDIVETDFGYDVINNISVKISRNYNSYPMTILCGQEILYADSINDGTTATFILPRGARVNKTLATNTGNVSIPVSTNYLLEY